MMTKLSIVALMVLGLGLVQPAAAQDNMMSGGVEMDPMAADCIAAAEAETDAMKMESMMTECATMYPEDVAMHCMQMASMETDTMKADEMKAECEAMAGGAMTSAM